MVVDTGRHLIGGGPPDTPWGRGLGTMIIVRAPLRITLGGGGTDIPDYYHKNGGFCIAAAIDKYVYVTVTRPFTDGIYLKYSKLERTNSIDLVDHSRIREALRIYGIDRIEITTLADIPAGTGLGSSSSFTVALIKALCAYQGRYIDHEVLAHRACEIELDKLHEPIGKQDQFIAAYGGIQGMIFNKNDFVETYSLSLKPEVRDELEENLLLFYTGIQRETSAFVPRETGWLDLAYEQGLIARSLLEEGKLHAFGKLLTDQYASRHRHNPQSTNPFIDEMLIRGMEHGAIGGKLVGAGGGGFLLFYAEEKRRLREAIREAGLEEVRFRFDHEGTKTLLV